MCLISQFLLMSFKNNLYFLNSLSCFASFFHWKRARGRLSLPIRQLLTCSWCYSSSLSVAQTPRTTISLIKTAAETEKIKACLLSIKRGESFRFISSLLCVESRIYRFQIGRTLRMKFRFGFVIVIDTQKGDN